jgi:hypothetical protein
MTTYALQTPTHAGTPIVYAAPSGTTGDLAPTSLPNAAGIALMVNNGATPTTVLLTALSVDGLPGAVRTVTIPATSTVPIPLLASVYGPGPIPVTYGNITTLTGSSNTGVAVITLPAT